MTDTETDGQRLKSLRKRAGLTQAELGDLAGHSQPWVSGVEKGDIELDSITLIARLAEILHVHPNEITGRPYAPGSADDSRGHAAIPAIRRVVQRFDLPPDWTGEPRAYADLAAAVARLVRLRRAARYADLGQAAPDVLREIHAAVDRAEGVEAERLWALLANGYKEADTVAHVLGYDDLSTLTTKCIRDAAGRSGDPNLTAIADYLRVRDLWALNLWADALVVIDRAADALEQTDPAAVSVWGSLQLRAAITMARASNPDEAWARMAHAQEGIVRAGHIGDPYGLTFTDANVKIHAVSVAVEMQDGARAVELISTTRLPDGVPQSRRGRYMLDMARGYVFHGDYAQALAAIEAAERLAPLLVRNNPMARAAVRALLTHERRSQRERLRRIAVRMQVA